MSCTLLPLVTCPVRLSVVVPNFTVIFVVSTLPMFSLKLRMIFEPSTEVLGASSPVVTSVGFTPSTLWFGRGGHGGVGEDGSYTGVRGFLDRAAVGVELVRLDREAVGVLVVRGHRVSREHERRRAGLPEL